jgi:hypothetical protein
VHPRPDRPPARPDCGPMLTRAGLHNNERKGRREPNLRLVTVVSVHEASRYGRLGLYGEPFRCDKGEDAA